MKQRHASCACGHLQINCEGEPLRVSICHCLDCQRRTGAPFSMQARYPRDKVQPVVGRGSRFTRRGDSGGTINFTFCPRCGSTVFWELSNAPGVIAVAVGAFADPSFPAPRHSFYESRRHDWVDLSGLAGIEHLD